MRDCERVDFPVALAEGQPVVWNVAGWLCGRGSIEHSTIQVLVHGSTYSHHYWNFPYRSECYSYVRAATLAGYATLAGAPRRASSGPCELELAPLERARDDS